MRIKKIEVFKYQELSESAQEQALEKFAFINVDYEWWEYTYEDAERIGLQIKHFNLDQGGYCSGHITTRVREVFQAILAEHGKTTDTYNLVKDMFKRSRIIHKRVAKKYRGEQITDLFKEFEYALLEEYLSTLRKEYDYLCSKEAIEETIKANEYEFTKEGRLA